MDERGEKKMLKENLLPLLVLDYVQQVVQSLWLYQLAVIKHF